MRRMTLKGVKQDVSTEISIHILHAEDDHVVPLEKGLYKLVQSTSSMRRMTTLRRKAAGCLQISIHILHAEDDLKQHKGPDIHHYFNPHPPCGG